MEDNGRRTSPQSRTKSILSSDLLFSSIAGNNSPTILMVAIPFWTVVCTTLKNGLAISVVAAMVLLPATFFCYILRVKLHLPLWGTAILCTIISLIITTLSTYVIRGIAPEITDSLGIYIYLTASFGVVAAALRGKEICSSGEITLWSLQYAGVFAICCLFFSALRETLAYGQLWGISLGLGFTVEGAKMPFFGFLLVGLILGFSQYAMRLIYICRHRHDC